MKTQKYTSTSFECENLTNNIPNQVSVQHQVAKEIDVVEKLSSQYANNNFNHCQYTQENLAHKLTDFDELKLAFRAGYIEAKLKIECVHP